MKGPAVLQLLMLILIFLVEKGQCRRPCTSDCDCYILYGERCVFRMATRKFHHCTRARGEHCFCKRGCMTAGGQLLRRAPSSVRKYGCPAPRVISQHGARPLKSCVCLNHFNNTMCCRSKRSSRKRVLTMLS